MIQPTRYEVLILTVPEITQDESKELENQFERVLQSHELSITSFEKWGKYKLAYPVDKNEYGVYYLARFQVPAKNQKIIDDIKSLFVIKLESLVMRNTITALGKNQPLEYQRPRSLEETPVREEGYTRERRHDRTFSTHEETSDMEQLSDDELQSA